MSDLATPTGWTTAGAAEAVSLPRRHAVAIAILMCVPLPLLSLAATVVPLPRMLERAAATFATLTAPALGGDASVIREKAVTVRSVEIQYEPREQPSPSTAGTPSPRADSQAPRANPASRKRARVAATSRPDSEAPADLPTDTGNGPVGTGTMGSEGSTPGAGETPTVPDPVAPPPVPAPTAEPPTSAAPPPSQGGGSAGSGTGGSGGAGGSKGTGGSGGAGGLKGTEAGSQKPPSGGGTPPDPGSGTTPPGGGGTTPPGGGNGSPGGASGSPPDAPPGGGNGGSNGGGKGKP